MGLDRPTAGHGDHQRPALRRPGAAAARGGGPARRRGRAPRPHRSGAPADRRPAPTASRCRGSRRSSTRSASGSAAGRRVKGYSLGMRQRLGIAAALLGDPRVLLFDEPVNGLDLDGVRWIRALLRGFADEGRTVLVSSHLMSEMQLVADRVVVIGRGRLIADADDRRGAAGPRRPAGAGAHPGADDLHRALTTGPAARGAGGRAHRRRRARGQRPGAPPRSGTSPTRSASRCTTWRTSSSRSSTPTSRSPRTASSTTATVGSPWWTGRGDEHPDEPDGPRRRPPRWRAPAGPSGAGSGACARAGSSPS